MNKKPVAKKPENSRNSQKERRSESVVPTYVELAKAGSKIAREVPAQSCLRLAAECKSVQSVKTELAFGWDKKSRIAVSGQAEADVELHCQLCIEPVTRHLQASVEGVLARSEIEAQAWKEEDDQLDIIVVSGPGLDILELIEDELLLRLPSQVCVDRLCANRPALSYGEDEGPATDTYKPFAALAELKQQKDVADKQ
ncbi:MAG: YceD family protein [Pseudomonadaceae bacterium]|nr:YceD family protein [Pseudomonadaceae bacterium]